MVPSKPNSMRSPAPQPACDTELACAQFAQAKAQLATRFQQELNTETYLREHSAQMDQLLQRVWAHAAFPPDFAICLMATGGYARRELYPHSDIDLLFLYEGERLPDERFIQSVLNPLWKLGLRVGYACRNLHESLSLALGDHTILTALIDARHLAGSQEVCDQFQQAWLAAIPAQREQFVQDKLQERQRRIQKYGDSRYLLEPDIKQAVGGLRDLHMLYWLARYYYQAPSVKALVEQQILHAQEYADYRKSYGFMATVRIALHLLSGRGDERLSFDRQVEISDWFGFRSHKRHAPVERFMKRYFQTVRKVGSLTRLFCALIEDASSQELHKAEFQGRLSPQETEHFTCQGVRLAFRQPCDLTQNPWLMLELFATAQEHLLSIHPSALREVSHHLSLIDRAFIHHPRPNAVFLKMLLSPKAPDQTLARLNEAGVLGKFIPDFAYLVGQIQYDRYHVYTVDEHTIRVIGTIHAIEQGQLDKELPLATEVIHRIHAREALYLAALCHDIAKGRGGSHEKRGVRITRKLGKRFGLDEATIELAAWLVEQHLLFSHTAFSRDLADPQTILDFVEQVQSPERLRLLLVLTVADIRGVGPAIWNGWKGALLRDLYDRAELEMALPSGATTREAAIQRVKALLADQLHDWPAPARESLLQEPSEHFWLGVAEEYHAEAAHLIYQQRQSPEPMRYAYEIHHFESITHLRLVLANRPGLLYSLAGCLSLMKARIVSISSATLQDGLALILLDIQDNWYQAYEDSEALDSLRDALLAAFADPERFHEKLRTRRLQASRLKSLPHAPSVYVHQALSATHTVIEVNATDRIGLLADITGLLSTLRLRILSSKITTYGDRAVDVFYVTDEQGHKLVDEKAITQLKEALLAMLAVPEPATRRKSYAPDTA